MITSVSQRLVLTRAVEDNSEELVDLAENTVSLEVIDKLRNLRSTTFMTQFNNLINVARETESPAVVRNWILYQMGRRDSRDAANVWKSSGLGDAILAGLVQVKAMVGRLETEPKPRRRLEIAMIRRYVGYLVRWYVAKGGQQ